MQLKFWTAVALISATLSACSADAPSSQANNIPENMASANDTPPTAAPDLFKSAGTPPENAAPATTAQPCSAGAQCFGSLVVQPGAMVLDITSGSAPLVVVTGAISIANRSQGPVAVAALDPARIYLDNGNTLSIDLPDGMSGLLYCGKDGQRCYDRASAEFRQITSEDSVARVNARFARAASRATRSTLPDVRTGEISMRLFVVPLGDQGRSIDVSLPDVPLRNQIKG